MLEFYIKALLFIGSLWLLKRVGWALVYFLNQLWNGKIK
jgi:hypothetical protein